MELREPGRATADATGRAVATVQPLRAFEYWSVQRLTVENTSSVNVPLCKVYRGSIAPTNLVDGTYTGTFDVSELSTPLTIQNGELLLAEWTGCDVGSQCTFTVTGSRLRT